VLAARELEEGEGGGGTSGGDEGVNGEFAAGTGGDCSPFGVQLRRASEGAGEVEEERDGRHAGASIGSPASLRRGKTNGLGC
jgi:hypothetical protein